MAEADPLDCKTEPYLCHSIKNEAECDNESSDQSMEMEYCKLDFDSSDSLKYESDSVPFEEVSCKREPDLSDGPEISSPGIETVYLETDTSQLANYVPEGDAAVLNSVNNEARCEKKPRARCEKCSKRTKTCLCFFSCQLCGKAFPTKTHLMRHVCQALSKEMIGRGQQGINKQTVIDIARPYHCTICDESFKDKITLIMHNRLHNSGSGGLHTCKICKKSFDSPIRLEQHSKSHSITYECRICKKVYSEKSEMKQHLKNECGGRLTCTQTDVNQQSDSKDTNTSQENSSSDINNRKTICPYCSVGVVTFQRHLERKHSSEPAVKEILCLPVRERSKFVKALCTHANFILPSKVHESPQVTKPNDSDTVKKCITCPYCKGSFNRRSMRRHRDYCSMRPKDEIGGKEYVLSTMHVAEVCSKNCEFYDKLKIKGEIFPIMRNDKISEVAMSDPLICTFAEDLLSRRTGPQVKYTVSNRMRELGRLMIALQKINGVKNLRETLKPQFFHDLVTATKVISGYDEETKTFKTRSLPLVMGVRLKQVCDFASKTDEYEVSEEALKDIKALRMMINVNWNMALKLSEGEKQMDGSGEQQEEYGNENEENDVDVVENQEEVKMNTDYITLVDEDFINNKRKYVEHTNKNDTEQERIKKEKVEDVILPDVEIEDVICVDQDEESVQNYSVQESGLSCGYCNEVFLANIHLKKHIATVHNNIVHALTYDRNCSKSILKNDVQTNINTIKPIRNNVHKTPASKKNHSQEAKRTSCEYCNKIFRPSYLQTHIDTVHYKIRCFTCKTCGKSFKQKSTLKTHQYGHENHRPFVCTICNKSYIQLSHLDKHVSNSHSEQSAACKVCGKTFKSLDGLENHLKGHMFRHECPICKKTYSYKGKLKYHLKEDHGVTSELRDGPPKIIKISLSDDENSDEEIIPHSNEIIQNSDLLEASVISNVTTTSVTNSSAPVVPIETVELQSSSEDCRDTETTDEDEIKMELNDPVLDEDVHDELFTKKEPTDEHEDTESQVEPNSIVVKPIKVNLPRGTTKCDVCGKSFANPCLLKRHIVNVHMNIRPFKCAVCNKTFHEKAVLKVHEAQHTNHRPFVCEICNKSYVCRSHFRRHMTTHGEGETWSCKVCKKVFPTSSRLRLHMTLHRKKYKCGTCGVLYATKHSLKRHVDEKHRGG